MSKDQEAEKVIRNHVLWSVGGGLIPIPLFDLLAVTAIQSDMLKQLATAYGVDHSNAGGKAFVTGLTGSTFARIGASALKAVPGIGTLLGGISMSAMSGASTYAVGQVAKGYFSKGVDVPRVDMDDARQAYRQENERGKQVTSDLGKDKEGSSETFKLAFEAISKLKKLKEKGVVSEEEFEVLKEKLLERL